VGQQPETAARNSRKRSAVYAWGGKSAGIDVCKRNQIGVKKVQR